MEHLRAMEVQGHRGDRGNFPENSIPAFISAVKKGVDVLEMDVVISADKKVVVSHEPYMASEYMLTPEGKPVLAGQEEDFNIFRMDYDSVLKFDGGSAGNLSFPRQQKMKTHKPLFSEVIDSVENYIRYHKLKSVGYNIELKSQPENYGTYQPFPEEFIDLVIEQVKTKGVEDKIVIQSFDARLLNLLRKKYPEIPISFLVGNGSLVENLSRLDFKPEIYSPDYVLLKNKKNVDSIKALGMKVIPWTVNEKRYIKQMIRFQVDGIITDYPERMLDQL